MLSNTLKDYISHIKHHKSGKHTAHLHSLVDALNDGIFIARIYAQKNNVEGAQYLQKLRITHLNNLLNNHPTSPKLKQLRNRINLN